MGAKLKSKEAFSDTVKILQQKGKLARERTAMISTQILERNAPSKFLDSRIGRDLAGASVKRFELIRQKSVTKRRGRKFQLEDDCDISDPSEESHGARQEAEEISDLEGFQARNPLDAAERRREIKANRLQEAEKMEKALGRLDQEFQILKSGNKSKDSVNAGSDLMTGTGTRAPISFARSVDLSKLMNTLKSSGGQVSVPARTSADATLGRDGGELGASRWAQLIRKADRAEAPRFGEREPAFVPDMTITKAKSKQNKTGNTTAQLAKKLKEEKRRALKQLRNDANLIKKIKTIKNLKI